MPTLYELEQRYPRGVLAASGPAVGLSPGQAASSELGHLAIGTGRVPVTDVARIDTAIQNGALATNNVVRGIIGRAKDTGGRLHLIGLVSDGGVHSSLEHLYALIDLAKKARVRVVVHALLDGRDVAPRTAPRYIADIEGALAGGAGRIGTVGGRFWGMDRDNRWERVNKCYRAIVAAEVHRADSAQRGIEESYAAGKTDEHVEPFVVFDYPGVSPVDTAIHFHCRGDGARELARALAAPSFDAFARKGGRGPFAGRLACMTTFDPSLCLPVVFPEATCPNTVSELLARAGYRQFRCAESAGSTYVTTDFNAGREEPFEGEDRKILPPAATYDIKTAAGHVAQASEEAIRSEKYDFVLVHLEARDVVGPTVALDAASPSVNALDAALGRIVNATRSAGGALIVTASHEGRELVTGPATGDPPARQLGSGVPFLYVNDAQTSAQIREGGTLCDVAPTVLELLELPRAAQMTGRSLLLPLR